MMDGVTDGMSIAKDEGLTDPSIAAGDRAYLIGTQDGGFPDLGQHVPGEMGGLWSHPIKLLDGFWLRIDDQWLPSADRFISGPFWNAHECILPDGLTVTRRQFAPDGERAIVVRYTLRSSVARTLRLRLLARSDLQGVWLSDWDGIHDGYDHAAYQEDLGAWLCRDDLNPWYVAVGARDATPTNWQSGRDLWGPERTAGRGVSVALDYTLALPGGNEEASIEFVVVGSDEGSLPARETFARVRDRAPALWTAKAGRYDVMLTRSGLDVPDPVVAAAWDWLKCNNDWLLRDVPGVGRGLGAGAPEYMWWFGCDNAYALLGCLALGQHETAIETLDLLRTLSEARNGDSGRVIHEANTRGDVFNPGNAQETPQFAATVWQTFLWTGDLDFLRRAYPFCRRGVLEWTLGACCPDGDVLPYGYGLIEMEGLNLQCVDTAAHTAAALDALAGMAEALGDEATAVRCRDLARRVRARVEEAFWLEDEGLYGDVRGTPAELAPRLRDWIGRAGQPDWQGEARPAAAEALRRLLREAESDPRQDRKRAWACGNWGLIAPLETGIAAPERARRALRTMESDRFSGRWGMYLNGFDRAAVMSISTGALAAAELTYGRAEAALGLVRTIAETLPLHMPGAISELSPDGGCFVQAWSGYAVAWPVVAGMFGVRPDAFRRRLALEPAFPSGWRPARLTNLRIGANSIDLDWDGATLTVTTRERGWAITSDRVPLSIIRNETR